MIKPVNEIGFEHYFIDDKGNVYSPNGKIRKAFINKQENNKYFQVVLQNKPKGLKPKAFYVHRLVAKTFIDNPNNLPQVNHIDRNRENNSKQNLEWCTGEYNNKHWVSQTEFERVVFDKVNSNKKLVEKGVNHYRIYKNVDYVNKLWNCSSKISYEILRLNSVKTDSRYKLSDVIRYEIADEIKSLGTSRLPHGYMDYLIKKYSKKYSISLSIHIIQKIKLEISKKIL